MAKRIAHDDIDLAGKRPRTMGGMVRSVSQTLAFAGVNPTTMEFKRFDPAAIPNPDGGTVRLTGVTISGAGFVSDATVIFTNITDRAQQGTAKLRRSVDITSSFIKVSPISFGGEGAPINLTIPPNTANLQFTIPGVSLVLKLLPLAELRGYEGEGTFALTATPGGSDTANITGLGNIVSVAGGDVSGSITVSYAYAVGAARPPENTLTPDQAYAEAQKRIAEAQRTGAKELELSGLGLTRVPPEIGQLRALTELALSGNRLSSVPPEIGQLRALTILGLTNNRLADLPLTLRELPQLRWLFLHNNPRLGLSPTILGPDPGRSPILLNTVPSAASILDAYFGRRGGAARPLNEVKLILVGRGGAGKTSIVRALRGSPFRKTEVSTPGIALSDWPIKGCKKGAVTAHVWDFAGQVITHALHQFFFSVRSVYILALTGRENSEREDAEYWLRLIKAFGSEDGGVGPPVIVALNKWDVKGCRPKVDRGALQERYPFIRGFVEVDCQTKRGIPKLRDSIARQVDRLKWVREPFKASWEQVRQDLTRGRKSAAYLAYDKFRKLCRKHGVKEAREQDSLAEILHNLGSALNYRNDPRLREATVLKPQWLTKNVYKLVRRAERAAGILKRSDIDAALASVKEQYMRHYLVRLMERFEIAYASREISPDTWVVPQALPDVQPKGAEAFATLSDATRLRYSYQAMPEGLVARAVVRLHEFIEEVGGTKQQWASGAVVAREGARALIRTEPQDRQVMITVAGPAEARRQLAGLCQAEMRDIHREIPGLDPLEETQVDGAWVATETLETDERKGKRTGVPTRDRGTVEVDPGTANNAYSKKAARIDEVWKPTAFICYSKKNVNQRKRLELELKILKNEGLLGGHWQDRMIDPGDAWDSKIKSELSGADIIIVLASSAGLSTDYITDTEIPKAMRLHEAGKAKLIPLVLEDCRWAESQLGRLQAIPEKGKPVNSWHPQSKAWKSIADGLAQTCKRMMETKQKGHS